MAHRGRFVGDHDHAHCIGKRRMAKGQASAIRGVILPCAHKTVSVATEGYPVSVKWPGKSRHRGVAGVATRGFSDTPAMAVRLQIEPTHRNRDTPTMQKIMIIGPSGAGKSTLARQLGEVLNLPVIHLDTFFWQPGWVRPLHDEWRTQQEQLLQGDSWIVDGEFTNTLEIRLAAADTIIMLDFPRILCLYRVFKRRFLFAGKTRPDMAQGCPEHIDQEFIWWIVWQYPTIGRRRTMQKIQEMNSAHKLIILRTPREVKRFVRGLQSQTEAASA